MQPNLPAREGFRAVSSVFSHSIRRGLAYLAERQNPEGSLHGDYDGPLFLLPGYIFAHYATQTNLPDDQQQGFVRTICEEQNADGGFGLHREGRSFLFSTVLNYVALRMLGMPQTSAVPQRAWEWLQARGGALAIPSWGKYWLAILRLYDWQGINPVLPEALLLPHWLPLHPGKMWCHARMVYLPVSYLYGRRWQVPDAPLLAELRGEIYDRPYAQVDFARGRSLIADTDLYAPPSLLLKGLHQVLRLLEPCLPQWLRTRALQHTLDHIKHEQLATSFIDIGPVSKCFDVVATYAAEPESDHTRQALDRLPAYLFPCERGLTMQAYNSSELWDTALAVQALVGARQVDNFLPFARQAYRFIDDNQILDDPPRRDKYFRDTSRGGWPFSNRAHGWPIADCTAEALKAVLALEKYVVRPIPDERLLAAVDRLLEWQNADGGWPTYEKNRSNQLLDILNPSELFGQIMSDRSFVELTSSAMQGLTAARKGLCQKLGPARLRRIEKALRRGVQFLHASQRRDGSWEGAWGICFTYGTWFAVAGLVSQGRQGHKGGALRRAFDFLLAHQLPDGGWGESYQSCVKGEYIQHPQGGQVVMTSWALLALLQYPVAETRAAIDRGLRFLLERQLDNGDWPQSSVTGVFNNTCMLNYRFYRNYFPIWALGLAERQGFLPVG